MREPIPSPSLSGSGVVELLADQPGDYSGVDAARTGDLARRLADRFAAYARGPRSKEDVPQYLGLFGGLGQGKTSTVVHAKALAQADGVDPNHFFEFDVASHAAAELLNKFDSILAALTGGRRATVGWLLSVTVTSLLAVLSLALFATWGIDDAKLWHKLIAAFSVVFCGGLAWVTGLHAHHRKVLQRVFERAGNLYGPMQVAAEAWHWLRRERPRWLIIDNLDRATVGQQCAVLRALHKQRDALRMHVLVCMDTTALLRSTPNPESPGELLRKVIRAEWHMPSRTPSDIWRMAGDNVAVAVRLNQKEFPAIAHIRQVSHIAALARVAYLIGCHSPRGMKHLVNDGLLLLTATWGFDRVDQGGTHFLNWAAALRLQGLWTFAPALRDHGALVAECLTENTPTAFERLLRGHCRPLGAALHYLIFTRHLRPIGGDWAPLTSATSQRWRSSPPPPTIHGEEQQEQVEAYERCDMLWAYLLECAQNGVRFSMSDLRGRNRVSGDAIDQGSAEYDRRLAQTAFGLAGLALATEPDAGRRARLVTILRPALAGVTTTLVAPLEQMIACDPELAQRLGPMVFEQWLGVHIERAAAAPEQAARDVRALVTLLPPKWFTMPVALAYAAWNCNLLESALLPWLREVQDSSRRTKTAQIGFSATDSMRRRLTVPTSLSTCWPVPYGGKAGMLRKVIDAWTKLCLIDQNPGSNADSYCPPALIYVLLDAPEFGMALSTSPRDALQDLAVLLWPIDSTVDALGPRNHDFSVTRWLAMVKEAWGMSGQRLTALLDVPGKLNFHQQLTQVLVACWLNCEDRVETMVTGLWSVGGDDAKIGLQNLMHLEANAATGVAIATLKRNLVLDGIEVQMSPPGQDQGVGLSDGSVALGRVGRLDIR